jgi:DNA-binding transcriptional ArsR family regulator
MSSPNPPRFGSQRSIEDTPDISRLARALADTTRSRLVIALMDGRAWTATELAACGDIAASTASGHLALLLDAGVVSLVRQGRHRYYRLLNPGIAEIVEKLMAASTCDPAVMTRPGPADPRLRLARVCYDHVAGEFGVELCQRMLSSGCITIHEGMPTLSASGDAWMATQGIDMGPAPDARRARCRFCLDWSERRDHLAGAVGSALLQRLIEIGALVREPASRALRIRHGAYRFLQSLSG